MGWVIVHEEQEEGVSGHKVRADYTKAANELGMPKAVVIKALCGESAFSKESLGTMISEAETKCAKLQKRFEDTQAAYEEGQSLLRSLEKWCVHAPKTDA